MVVAKALLFLFLLMASFMVATFGAAAVESDENGQSLTTAEVSDDEAAAFEGDEPSPLLRRLLVGIYRRPMTCDRHPKVCQQKGSRGKSCCRKRCVNLKTDNLNCGRCGNKCRYGELCCRGRCTNVLFDPKNCGGCQKKCKRGSYCRYGMCSYSH